MDGEGLRRRLAETLGIPAARAALDVEWRGSFCWDGVRIDRLVYISEPGSHVPAVLYRPEAPEGPVPAIALTFGHGGSKSHPTYQYLGQLYARLGIACLAADPLGEEERHLTGGMGTRAHDPAPVAERARAAGRLIMGKLVFDTMRGLDLLEGLEGIDPARLGVAGNSLGGAVASWMAALDTRLRAAIVSGWAYDDAIIPSKLCTRWPAEAVRAVCGWGEFLSLAAPHCAVLVMNGDADTIIDREGAGGAWHGTRNAVDEAAARYAALGAPDRVSCWFEPGGGHRPYPARTEALEWLHAHLGTPGWSLEALRALPTVNYGAWADRHDIAFEPLYGTDLHYRGATLADLNIRPLPREALACLRPDELGAPAFTLEGWLEGMRDEG